MRLVFDNKFKLTDRERMLAILADCMRTDALLGRGRLGGSPDQEAVATYEKPKPGDLVCCYSVRSLYFRFSWFVEDLRPSQDFFVVRELGGPRLCNIWNDEAYRCNIKDYMQSYFLEGAEWEHYQKIQKAFYGLEEGYSWRAFRGISWDGPREFASKRIPTLMVGEKFSDKLAPFVLSPWTRKTTLREIKEDMKAKGVLEAFKTCDKPEAS